MFKVLIVSYFFYPENTPRAFRTTELVKEFLRLGYSVELYIPNYNYNYKNIFKGDLKIFPIETGFFLAKNQKRKRSIVITAEENSNFSKLTEYKSKIKNYLINKYCYFLGDLTFEYGINLYKELKKNDKSNKLIISIGLPLSVHVATGLSKSKKKSNAVFIADWGDPFATNPNLKLPIYFKWIEFKIMKKFDYILIPDKNAKKFYTCYKKEIKVIPQGINIQSIEIEKYKKNKIPTFGYAGNFYEDIRNPKLFFEFLINLKKDFKFIIYTDKNKYKYLEKLKEELGDKIEINDLIPREKCIKKMSKMDFLINISNIEDGQIPSKLIDYAISKRPIISFKPTEIPNEKFLKFLERDYSGKLEIDLNEFDIRNVVNQIIKLKN